MCPEGTSQVFQIGSSDRDAAVRSLFDNAGLGDLSGKSVALKANFNSNHPLVDGNKRVGCLRLAELVERNGYAWTAPAAEGSDGDETVEIIERVAAGSIDQPTLAAWIADRIASRWGHVPV